VEGVVTQWRLAARRLLDNEFAGNATMGSNKACAWFSCSQSQLCERTTSGWITFAFIRAGWII
jgi:hypothetical protein